MLCNNNNNNTSRSERGTPEAGCVQKMLPRIRQEVGQNCTVMCCLSTDGGAITRSRMRWAGHVACMVELEMN